MNTSNRRVKRVGSRQQRQHDREVIEFDIARAAGRV